MNGSSSVQINFGKAFAYAFAAYWGWHFGAAVWDFVYALVSAIAAGARG